MDYSFYNKKSMVIYSNQNISPCFFLHLAGASGIMVVSGSFLHSNPSAHVPQLKLSDGLKHGPQSSPSCFSIDSSNNNTKLKFVHLEMFK